MVSAYVLEGDALVGHVLDGAGGAGDGLDANTVVGVDDLRVKAVSYTHLTLPTIYSV